MRAVTDLPRAVGLVPYSLANQLWRTQGSDGPTKETVRQSTVESDSDGRHLSCSSRYSAEPIVEQEEEEEEPAETVSVECPEEDRRSVVRVGYNVPWRRALPLAGVVLQLKDHWENSPSSDD
jgi:hypothetical protein